MTTATPAEVPSRTIRSRRSLGELRRGETAVVQEACSDPADAAILRAMGLRRNTRVRLCRSGEPCIVSILEGSGGGEGCRIGLARLLAGRVVVEVE